MPSKLGISTFALHQISQLAPPGLASTHLQLARAYAVQSDIAKAKAAYHDFLTLWKDAAPESPILSEARAEYAKLQ